MMNDDDEQARGRMSQKRKSQGKKSARGRSQEENKPWGERDRGRINWGGVNRQRGEKPDRVCLCIIPRFPSTDSRIMLTF